MKLVLVEMFKAHLVMIQRKSANPYARKTEKGPRPGGAVKAPVLVRKKFKHTWLGIQRKERRALVRGAAYEIESTLHGISSHITGTIGSLE